MNKKIYLFMLLMMVFPLTMLAQQTWYVTPTGVGTGTGSWGNASSDLQAVINASAEGDEIWVAAGTYTPTQKPADFLKDGTTPTTARDQAFILKPGVKTYGGFAGTEGSVNDRAAKDPITAAMQNETILSGDLGTDGKAYHVIVGYIPSATTALTVLDGFTIKDGLADGAATEIINIGGDIQRNQGGGVNIFYQGGSNKVALHNLLLYDNVSSEKGGGLYAHARTETPELEITDSKFTANTGTQGGGVYFYGAGFSTGSTLNIDKSTFDSNVATTTGVISGAGVYHYNGKADIKNSTFENHVGKAAFTCYVGTVDIDKTMFRGNSGTSGGAIYISSNTASSYPTVTITNSVFYDNEATATGTANSGGAAIYVNIHVRATVINSTFYKNKSANAHGAITFNNANNTTLNLYNNIFNGNYRIDDNSSVDVRLGYAALGDFKNNLFQVHNLAPVDNNNYIEENPVDLFASTTEGEYNFLWPKQNGYVVDKGNKDFYINNVEDVTLAKDYLGNDRLSGAEIDLGAIEWDIILPVQVSSFTANLVNGRTQLKWSVGTEDNVNRYEVERSQNGTDFTTVATVGANGASSYNTTDNHPVLGVNYYRLVTIDNDGALKAYDRVQTVTVATLASEGVGVYPNPATGSEVNVSLGNVAVGTYTYKIVSTTGSVVQQGSINYDGTSAVVSVGSLPAGVYVLQFSHGAQAKLIKQ